MNRSPPSNRAQANRYLSRLLADDGDEPIDLQSFEQYARRTSVRLTQALALFGCALAVVFWPMDFFVFAADPRRLRISFEWRSIIALTMLLIVLLGRRYRHGRDGAMLVITGLFFAITAITFVTASVMGGASTPWFYAVFSVPLFTTMVLVGLAERVLLVYGGVIVALASYFAVDPGHAQDPFVAAFLGVLAGVSMLFVAVGHMLYFVIRTNFEQRQELRRLSLTDPLTDVANHGHLRDRATHEVARARRSSEPLSLLMIDVDHFKAVNDSFGHATGDAVLRSLAALFRRVVREIDVVGRMGGEEFAIVLPSTSLPAAVEVAERVRGAVEATRSFDEHGPVICTVSIGCAELTSSDDDVEALLRRADQALYDAKAAGRNRVATR